MQELKNKIKVVFGEFYNFTDAGHRFDHIETVMSNVEWFTEQLCWGKYLPLSLIAAGAHDIFSTVEDRDVHHEKAYSWILENGKQLMVDFPEYVKTDDDVKTIAFAALEHRSSFPLRTYYSPVSELVSAADRGIVTANVGSYFERSYLYARSSAGKSVEDSIEHAIEHIKEKFGRGMNNHVAVPIWYKLLFQDVLQKRTMAIMTTTSEYFTPEKLRELESLCK